MTTAPGTIHELRETPVTVNPAQPDRPTHRPGE